MHCNQRERRIEGAVERGTPAHELARHVATQSRMVGLTKSVKALTVHAVRMWRVSPPKMRPDTPRWSPPPLSFAAPHFSHRLRQVRLREPGLLGRAPRRRGQRGKLLHGGCTISILLTDHRPPSQQQRGLAAMLFT